MKNILLYLLLFPLFATAQGEINLFSVFNPAPILTGAAVGGSLAGTLPNPIIAPNVIDSTEITNQGITTDNVRNGSVTSSKLSRMGATTDQFLKWDGSAWIPATVSTVQLGTLETTPVWNGIDAWPSGAGRIWYGAATVPDEYDGWTLIEIKFGTGVKGTHGGTPYVVRGSIDPSGGGPPVFGQSLTWNNVRHASSIETRIMSAGDRLYVDIQTVGNGTAPQGMFVTWVFQKPN